MKTKGIIAISFALTVPFLAFLILLIIEFSFYFLGMIEANFITLDIAKYMKSGESVENYFVENRVIFDDFCLNSNNMSAYDVAVKTVTSEGNQYRFVELSCAWDFELSSAFIDSLSDIDLTPAFGFQSYILSNSTSNCVYVPRGLLGLFYRLECS